MVASWSAPEPYETVAVEALLAGAPISIRGADRFTHQEASGGADLRLETP